MCQSDTPIIFTCPTNTLFNPISRSCAPSEDVVCTPENPTDNVIDSTIREDPARTMVTCSNDGDLIPNPRNCQEFFMCQSDTPIIFTCPTNTLFNPLSSSCDLSEDVVCILDSTADVAIDSAAIRGAPASIEENNEMCIDQPTSTLVANSESCSRFIQCTKVGPIEFSCPDDMLFDTPLKTCLAAENANCGANGRQLFPPMFLPPVVRPPVVAFPPAIVRPPVVRPPLIPPAIAWPPLGQPPIGGNFPSVFHTICLGQPAGTKMRNPLNCRQFVHCTGRGVMRFQDCPAGTAFDNFSKVCDWSQNVNCLF